MEGGELEHGNDKMAKKKKKKRTFLERAVEAITGAFMIYLSSSATVDVFKIALILSGFGFIIYSVVSE